MEDTAASSAGTIETRADLDKGDAGLIRLWKDAIKLQRQEEADWRKRADDAMERYRDEKDRAGTQRFNILFANLQTIVPALYNSTPQPDVRRRFGDADPAGKVAAQVLERAATYGLDVYDFDAVMRAVVFDSEAVGRGLARVRYEPTFDKADTIVDEAVVCELVNWRDFIRGPGRTWRELPWIAFEHRMTRDELTKQFGSAGAKMELDFCQTGKEKEDKRDVPDIFKRGTVYEIWDKEGREVLFIAETVTDKILKRIPDPLRLVDFFPVPRPVYGVFDSSSLTPVCPYSLYADQARELDRVTSRITLLVAVMKMRGFRASELAGWDKLAEAIDGDLVPVENWQQFMATAGGGLDKAIWLWPIEQIVAVVRELVAHREQIKQVIYEITGLSDILRGASEAGETATAQQIKSQWGSLRVQDRQKEVERFARDLIRMKSEIVAEHFQPQTLSMMTGIDLPPDDATVQMAMQSGQVDQNNPPPTWEQVMGVLRSDAMRSYRVDIETQSTIQADVMRAQQNAAAFVQGFAGLLQAFGPAVQMGAMPPDVAVDITSAFSRTFKLGRQAEDAIERWGQMARQMPAPGSQPDPAAQAKAEAEAAKAETMKFKARADIQKTQATTEAHLVKTAADMEAAQQQHDMRQAERGLKLEEMFARAVVQPAQPNGAGRS